MHEGVKKAYICRFSKAFSRVGANGVAFFLTRGFVFIKEVFLHEEVAWRLFEEQPKRFGSQNAGKPEFG
ncbi:MAG TPA: hypothetical protein VI875_04090 [Candidatus Norongarragalinales archaeon]|nr:hypothetical protein [Candidatus Norongarragalinales archaeon]